MKKTISAFLLISSCLAAHAAVAAIPWWQQPTICKPVPTQCYANMSNGFEAGMWDATGNCWGLKIICPEALAPAGNAPVAMGKKTIANGTGINSDFDTNMFNNDCFGARKTIANGSQASVGGAFVNVWCSGVLSSADEELPTGEITFGSQPTCSILAADGWVAALNQKCYGKYYDPANYYIECEGNDLLPKRLITLNGAEAVVGAGPANSGYPADKKAADELFDKMQSVSAAQKAKYF
ncbi:MAG: hypothetical protein LBD50_03140 [Rickettsiales bacterium]|jgi:hypothetical protein|nr:hypothetical protein [Rickettsiales bacterium]